MLRPSAYRPDIDGLRAIAVLLVLGFHAFPKAVPGGFIGVDVFFVISGFLITSLIAHELDEGRFSLLTFYSRRARRIFPALFIVLLACLAAGWVWLLPSSYRDLGADAAWSAAFLANVALYFQSGYFDAAAETKPLLHLWSLGIEEQFYVFWPLLLILAAPRKWMGRAALMVLVASFACNIALTMSDRAAAFYLPVSRVWELAAGALLALHAPKATTLRVRDTAAWAGLALLVVAVIMIDRESMFPGWWAALPVVATALMIQAGPDASLNRLLLSHRHLVAIGLISYPLYLWHWPLLVFARIARFGHEPTILMKVLLLGASFALAYLTYRFIERAFRFGVPTPLKPLGATAGVAAAACLGLLVWSQAGLASRFRPGIQNLVKDFQTEANRGYRTGICLLDRDQGPSSFKDSCVFAPPGTSRLALLWGDSYAAHLYPGLADLQAKQSIGLAQYTASGCPPILGFTNKQRPNCAAINDFVLTRIQALKPHTVILSARWNAYLVQSSWGTMDRASVQATLDKLAAIGVQRVVVVGQFPDWTLTPSHILIREQQRGLLTGSATASAAAAEYNRTYLDPKALGVDGTVEQFWSTPRTTFIAPHKTLCRGSGCRLTTPGPSPQPTAWDQGHLTVAASIYFATANAEQLLGPAN